MGSPRIAGLALAGLSTLCFSLAAHAQADVVRSSGSQGSSAPVPPLVVPNATLSQGFELVAFPPTGWIVRNQSTTIGTNAQCWNRFTTTPWAPNTGVGHAGANFNCTGGANTISGFLISEAIPSLQNGDIVSFFTRKATTDTFPDRLQLLLCTDTTPDSCGAAGSTGSTSTDVGQFTTTLVDINPTLVTGVYPTVFTQFSATLSGLPGAGVNGRIAFRYFVTNGGPSGANSDIISIDDVAIVAGAPTADLSITKTDGTTTATAGGSTTYTITASNAGPAGATGATVADTFPAACTTVSWTCVGAGGGTCTAAGTGNINDTVNLPSGGSVTYTATCNISIAATGTLANTATVTAPVGVTDPPANNTATDTDTISGPALTSTPPSGSTINFNQQLGGAAATSVITFNNPGGTPATVTCTPPAAPQFSVAPTSIPVPAGGSNTTTVSFSSTSTGTFTGSLVCTAGTQTFTFNLNGTTTSPTSVPTLGAWARWLLVLSTLVLAGFALSRRRANA